ncbi:helix-turn-helix domain-containing protein [Riemerella columbipharyngis]|uniref:UvrD-like helicase C-terminal domain-containing protein n=1 Tax=Riemerella columbipharyngis TaxID=1071918 RepID=A0A1G6YWJ5_9FLAO|nr:helix-turn-helix domain-containing protein [Riemerella columbipharyngis]SDD94874.1 UvrD-like helicase C-terminal domain-containing protein [Riemerella columbipharyngis]
MDTKAIFELLEYTGRNVFLTGKAGTGKTTFLSDFVRKTHKKYIVLAPTGIAAINAGGVTIHSMFGLPLRSFFPTIERIDENMGNNILDLVKHFKFRKNKLKLLRELEMIIIDEVSMLRADVLDMMDFALRNARRSSERFGGIQMLFIGDLFQLPPVVRDEHHLKKYYDTPFFFSAKAFEDIKIVTIELTKIYRQTDDTFLSILNEIRDGKLSRANYEKLNARYIEDFQPPDKERYVYLTSHNRIADGINEKKLEELNSKPYFYKAGIKGTFNENQYPNDLELQLKVGAQIMFIRNDASGERKYFNGKLAQVTHLTKEEIWVKIEGDTEEYLLKKETWEHKRYSINKNREVEEEVLGSFVQYPIRLAWAVTIHKSQGLTFDRVIVDAGKSFASGQVYVALSRCRTLEGIVLKSKISESVIFNDARVVNFQNETNANTRLSEIIHQDKYNYSIDKVLRSTDCNWIKKDLEQWHNQSLVSRDLNKEAAKGIYISVKSALENLIEVHSKFDKILRKKTWDFTHQKEEWKAIEEKSKGAAKFFFTEVKDKVLQPLFDFYQQTKGQKGLKAYNVDFKVLLDDLEEYLEIIQNLKLMEEPLFNIEELKNDVKPKKQPTHIISFQMLEQGKTIAEIAKERGLVEATIYGHLAKFASQGLLELERVTSKSKIEKFEKIFNENPQDSLSAWKAILPEDFGYGEIRLLWEHYKFLNLSR